MINRVLLFLVKALRLKSATILVRGKPYLRRYYIVGNLYLHQFLSGDGDRHLHDHPWHWAYSIVLCGGYVEKRATGIDDLTRVMYRKVRFGNFLTGMSLHQVTSVAPNTWTLFHHGKVGLKRWGFYEQVPSDQKNVNYVRGQLVETKTRSLIKK